MFDIIFLNAHTKIIHFSSNIMIHFIVFVVLK